MKTKKIDFSVVLAVVLSIILLCLLIFGAYVGITGNYKVEKKGEVAYADTAPINNNLLRTEVLYGYYTNSAEYVSVATDTIYTKAFSYITSAINTYPLYGTWLYNDTSSSISYEVGVESSSRFTFRTQTSVKSGIYFPLDNTLEAGSYTFCIYNYAFTNKLYSLCFYTLFNGTLVQLSDVLSYNDNGTYNFVSFDVNSSFDNLYLSFTGQYQYLAWRGCALVSGSVNSYLFHPSLYVSGYSAGYNNGYYTGLAASDDGGSSLDLVGNNMLEYQFNQPWQNREQLIMNNGSYKDWTFHGWTRYKYDFDDYLSDFYVNSADSQVAVSAEFRSDVTALTPR